MATLRPVALVTGASSGIGAALARIFAAHGHAVVLVGRREGPLNRLGAELAVNGADRPLVIPLDLTRIDTPARISQELGARGLEPAFVVNNAGYGLVGRAADLDRADQMAMLDLNVRALTDLSLRFIESLGRHRGGILNVASVAAFLPGPGMALYHATKAYVVSLSEALHVELAARNPRHGLVPGPGSDRVSSPCGARPRPPASVCHPFGGMGGAAGLRRLDARRAHCGSRLGQQDDPAPAA
jgi:short-subunit dehydrogenase